MYEQTRASLREGMAVQSTPALQRSLYSILQQHGLYELTSAQKTRSDTKIRASPADISV